MCKEFGSILDTVVVTKMEKPCLNGTTELRVCCKTWLLSMVPSTIETLLTCSVMEKWFGYVHEMFCHALLFFHWSCRFIFDHYHLTHDCSCILRKVAKYTAGNLIGDSSGRKVVNKYIRKEQMHSQ